jgi:hypothetical protein
LVPRAMVKIEDIYGFFVRKQKRIEGHLIKPVVV